MAHGKTLEMKAIKRPEATYLVSYFVAADKSKVGRLVKVGNWNPYRNENKDRALAGKARRRARQAGR